jgi:hypothetical protein
MRRAMAQLGGGGCKKVESRMFRPRHFATLKDKTIKYSFPNLYKLLQIAIAIPVSSATCGEVFQQYGG